MVSYILVISGSSSGVGGDYGEDPSNILVPALVLVVRVNLQVHHTPLVR